MSVPKFCLLILMIAVPASLRLVDMGWNAIPMGAVALFAGATFRNRWLALAVPVCAMLISDLALGWVRHDFLFYTFHPLLPVVYGCYILSVCLGFGVRAQWSRLDAAQGGGEVSVMVAARSVGAGVCFPGELFRWRLARWRGLCCFSSRRTSVTGWSTTNILGLVLSPAS